MKKLFFKKNKLNFYIISFLIILFGVLIFNLIPSIGKAVSRLAIFSTKLNFSKNLMGKSCFNNSFEEKQMKKTVDLGDERKKSSDILNVEGEGKKDGDFGKGPIVRRKYEALNNRRFVNIGGTAYVQNMTSLSNKIITDAVQRKPAFSLEKTNKPQVLIYHTHTTESYEQKEKDTYDKNVPTRSKNSNLNVIAVGNEIAEQVKSKGIEVIHDTTIYDDPAYSGAYDRTNAMIKNYLKKYGSIKVVLDIHRDSITNQQKERVAPVTMIKGEKVAQLMIISGCDNGSGTYNTFEKNLSFACFLEKQIEKDYPNLTRPVSFKYKHYNQSLSPGALLVEVGSQANSIEEAKLCGKYFGKSLAEVLVNLQSEGKEVLNKNDKSESNLKQAPKIKQKQEKTKEDKKEKKKNFKTKIKKGV